MKRQVFKALTLSLAISAFLVSNNSFAQTAPAAQTATPSVSSQQVPTTKHGLMKQNEQLRAENTQLRQQVEMLRSQLDGLRQELSSEKTKKYQDCLRQSGFKLPAGAGLQTPTLTMPAQQAPAQQVPTIQIPTQQGTIQVPLK